MSGDKRARLKQWLESGEARLHPLAFPQRELWETSNVPIADPANHVCCLIHARGSIVPGDCEAAVQRVVERQEVLRLSFLPGKSGPLQMVRGTGEANFRYRELLPSQTGDEAIEELAGSIFNEPFDLMQGPLYRVDLVRRSAEDHVLVFAIHHSIADGWSLGVFVQDLCGAYLQKMMLGKSDALPPVPQTYTAWAAAERAQWQPNQLQPCADFWKARLAGSRRIWESPAGPVSVSPLQRWVGHFPADLSRAARDLARAHAATLFSTLLAVFQIALARWTGVDDIVVGTPVANRGKQTVRETMGYCAGNVPLRGQVEVDRPFSDSLRGTHESTIDSFAHAMPFAELVRALGETPTPGRHPIYQVRFALQNHPIPDVNVPALSARLQMRSTGTARFDLGCEVTEMGEELEVVWLFRPDLFSETAMADLKQLFQTVLTNVCRSPASRISALTN